MLSDTRLAAFTRAIGRTFFSSPVEVLDHAEQSDGEGGIVRALGDPASVFRGNVRYSRLAELARDYGITAAVDVAVTAPEENALPLGAAIRAGGAVYRVTACVPSETHVTITGELWR